MRMSIQNIIILAVFALFGSIVNGSLLRSTGTNLVTDALGNEIDLHGQWWTARDRDVFHGNIRINENQPPSVKALTTDGFLKRKIPEQLFRDIKTFLDENKNSEVNEGTVPGYIVGTTTWMVYVDGTLHRKVDEAMKPILRDWVGGLDLSYSSIYGLRKYTTNSTLQVHVDSGQTHIVSAILHIDEDYTNLQKPEHWPLQIQDHQGNVHEVVLEPGEMCLYESAKLIHGRPKYFKGKAYWNLFVHYRPSNNEHLVIGEF